jgi:HEAT repeat protein
VGPIDLPGQDLPEALGWILLVLLTANVLLFVSLVFLRERWIRRQHAWARIRDRLEPLVDRLISGVDRETSIAEVSDLLLGLDDNERAVAGWLLIDHSRLASNDQRARLSESLVASGATEFVEHSTHRRMPWRRALACDVLGAIGAERSVSVLEERLNDSRAEVRRAAVRALGASGSAAAAAPLAGAFLDGRSVSAAVTQSALIQLGPAGADAFAKGLSSTDETVRLASCSGVAATATGETQGTAADLLAGSMSRDTSGRVRAAAARAAGLLGSPGLAGPLSEAAHDPDPRVRRDAARALGSFGSAAAVDALIAASDDPDRETALRAAESLFEIRRRRGPEGAAASAALESSSAWSVKYCRSVGFERD